MLVQHPYKTLWSSITEEQTFDFHLFCATNTLCNTKHTSNHHHHTLNQGTQSIYTLRLPSGSAGVLSHNSFSSVTEFLNYTNCTLWSSQLRKKHVLPPCFVLLARSTLHCTELFMDVNYGWIDNNMCIHHVETHTVECWLGYLTCYKESMP